MRRNRIWQFVLMSIFVVSFLQTSAQDTTNTIGRVSIASPTAASLGKYGDIPVSYHTGLPEVSIPIYTVQSGSIKLSIGLSYHASGLKVQEQASWVGAGWSLNAGGAITRSVMGAADDRGYSTTNVTNGHYTDLGFNSYLNNTGGIIDDINFAKGFKDGEPDLYFFNFGGYSGKFYFNDDRTAMLVPEQDFKIQAFTQSGQGFIGFIITASDGAKYYFGQIGNNYSVAPIEATNPFTVQNGPSNTSASSSSWFLNKIISADGTDSITLSYQQENYSYYALMLSPVLSTNYNQIGADFSLQNGVNVSKNLVQGVRLSQIFFPNGKITFTAAASARTDLSSSAGLLVSNSMTDNANTSSFALGSISITNNNGFCKKDSFYYSYFFDNNALNSYYNSYSSYNIHSDQYKLRLDSVQEYTCDGSLKVPPYKFGYFTELVPRRLSFGADHWGFSNGQTSNSGMVPTFTVITNGAPQTTAGANRDAAWPDMRGGTLQKIIYPTGGFTNFDFEPKNIYTFNNTTLQQVSLANYVAHEFGQSQLTQTVAFTLSGTGATVITVHNTSTNWSPTFSIVDGNNVQQGGGPWTIAVSSTFNQTISLPAGNYSGTLSFPSNSGGTLINGADANVSQWQNVTSQTTQTVGGLRIKTITNNDGLTSNNIVTSYTYPTPVLYSIPTYVQVLRNDLMAFVSPDCSPNGCLSCDGTAVNAHTYYISAGNIRPMASLQGENMGYDEVDVTQTGNGHSVYRYYSSNIWNSSITDVCVRSITQSSLCDVNIPNFPFAPLPFEFMREELKYEGHFNEVGKILKETYYYPVYSVDPLVTPGHISVNLPSMFSYTEYKLQTASKTQNKTVQTLYDPNSSNYITISNTIYYGSGFHHQVTRTVNSTSMGDTLATNAKYAMDFRIASCDAIPDSLSYYNTQVHNDSIWMFSNIASCTPQPQMGVQGNCRPGIFGQFRQMMAQARQQFIAYRRRSFAPDTSNVVSRCYLTAIASADTLLRPILRLQNMYENVPIETSEWKNVNLLHASFTRYDSSLSPTGYAYPGRTKLINLQQPSASFTVASVSGSTITKDSRYIDESLYSFSNGNPLQVTARDGVANSYIWDYLNTQPIAKATNASQSDIAYSSFEADGKGNWAFTGAPVSDVSSPTGSKCYGLASGAISKSGLSSSTVYVVSYWSKTGASYTVTGSSSVKQGKTINGWTYFEHTATGASTISVSGTGSIDELRLYPVTAQMTTYTYTPVLGMTSACDADNKITYYFYDGLGRLKWIKDQDLNIIKTIQYHYQNVSGISF